MLFSLVGMCGLLVGLGFVVTVQYYMGDTSELKESTIRAKMNEETTIYYADGKHRIGSLFEGIHRKYISIEEVPVHVVNAIIASEDKNFYRHYGIDFAAIAKAFIEGLEERSFRRGGSTITQQTVKNILGRWEKSFARKYREIIAAMQRDWYCGTVLF